MSASNFSNGSSLLASSEAERALFESLTNLASVKIYSALFVLLVGILAFLANVLVLLTFFCRRQLITPFTVHVIAITIINLSVTVIYLPMQISTVWKRPRAACAFFLYVQGSMNFNLA